MRPFITTSSHIEIIIGNIYTRDIGIRISRVKNGNSDRV